MQKRASESITATVSMSTDVQRNLRTVLNKVKRLTILYLLTVRIDVLNRPMVVDWLTVVKSIDSLKLIAFAYRQQLFR